MLQKLYKHLEEINNHLRQDKIHAAENRLGDKIDKLLLLQQAQPVETALPEMSGVRRILPIANLLICSIGIIVLFALTYYTFQLAQMTHKMEEERLKAPVKTAGSAERPNVYFAQMEASIERQSVLQQQLAKLDSLVVEQAKSIKELKNLNVTAVATFKSIRKQLFLSDSLRRAQHPVMDSLGLAK